MHPLHRLNALPHHPTHQRLNRELPPLPFVLRSEEKFASSYSVCDDACNLLLLSLLLYFFVFLLSNGLLLFALSSQPLRMTPTCTITTSRVLPSFMPLLNQRLDASILTLNAIHTACSGWLSLIDCLLQLKIQIGASDRLITRHLTPRERLYHCHPPRRAAVSPGPCQPRERQHASPRHSAPSAPRLPAHAARRRRPPRR